ncbi:hypothetical protein [Halobacillus litoralis]|uniref:hypothetical protein n=1 Tax=Halobacillus litoralis TaxID=45668 RepID=UPI001CD7EFDA|nr:hypothetical protein [Halobacillus litoralis]MCA1021610.1 hypothetical protein [Halobacillus litoralis]
MKTSEQRKRDNWVSDLIYGKTVDLGLGDKIVKSHTDHGATIEYGVISCGEWQKSFKDPYAAISFVLDPPVKLETYDSELIYETC